MRPNDHRTLRTFLRACSGVLLAALVWLATAEVVLAAPKKKEEPAAAPTKSYTVPYMVVLAFLGIGMMAVCRPSGRLDKMDDMLKKKDDEA